MRSQEQIDHYSMWAQPAGLVQNLFQKYYTNRVGKIEYSRE